jgi:hypothetical protein
MNESNKNKDLINNVNSDIDNINKGIEKLTHNTEPILNDFNNMKSENIHISEDILQIKKEINETSKNVEHIKKETKGISDMVEQLKEEKESVVLNIKQNIQKWYKIWSGRIFGSWCVLTIISVVAIYFSVINNTEKFMTGQITQKFDDPEINRTFTMVAENEAKKIIDDRLAPAIKEANQIISESLGSFETSLQEFKNNYDMELKKLASEVDFLKNRNEILKLSDESIANGDALSFEKLEKIYHSSEDKYLKQSALSEILRIKGHFSIGSSIIGINITYNNPKTGTILKDDEIPTSELINQLRNNTSEIIRKKITELLKTRKEKQVPEVLLDAIKNDNNLEVRRNALQSFESVTGFKRTDVFNYEPAKKWWDENKEKVEKNLKD